MPYGVSADSSKFFTNTFQKPDIPSWDIMPESWSGDNWIKKIAANAD